MKIIRSIEEMSAFTKRMRLKAKSIAFVPTMGALHAGHLSLIKAAGRKNDITVVSIFVNPIQFGPKEDFRRYPRNLKRDAQLCRRAGVEVLFCPSASRIYPPGYRTYIKVNGLSQALCGKFRPGHFGGVATVVMKLINIVGPQVLYMGQKDVQQAIIIAKMLRDLNLSCRLEVLPTVREKDGLAMSSRNSYLNKEEREQAKVIYQALCLAGRLIRSGIKDAQLVIRRMKGLIAAKNRARIEYISIVRPKDLEPVARIKERVLIAVAAWIGRTRLIDNIIVAP